MKKMKLLTLIASIFMVFACSSRTMLAQEVDKQDTHAVVGFYKTSGDNTKNSSEQSDTSDKFNDHSQDKAKISNIDTSSGKNFPKTGSQIEHYLFIWGLTIVLAILILFLKKEKRMN